LAASALHVLGNNVSVPHALGFRSSGPFSDLVAGSWFPKNPPLLRFPAKPHGLASTLQRLPLTGPAAPSALSFFQMRVEVLALLSFCTSQVSLHRIFEEASTFFVPFSLFLFRLPKKPETGVPRDSFRRFSVSLLSKGAHLPGVYDRLSSATSLECEPVAAYFFSSEFLDSLRPPRSPSLRPAPPRLTGSGTSFRPH
jgi:hypothetical protein